MKTNLLGLLFLLPTLALAQFVNIPDNRFPVISFNLANQTDHTTDVHILQGKVLQTGFFQEETDFWGYDASVPNLFYQNTLADGPANQAYFATRHDNFGDMDWFLVSDQSGTSGVTYGNSKIAYNDQTGNYLICIEFKAPAGTPLTIVSSTGSSSTIFAPSDFGFYTIEVDSGGNIVAASWALSSGAQLVLGNVDVEESSNELYITGYRIGGLTRAFILSTQVGINGPISGISESGGSNSWGRGIDVESGFVYVTGDFQNFCQWGAFGSGTPATVQDVYVVQLDLGLNVVDFTIAEAAIFAEAYDLEAFPNPTNVHLYVTGSIEQECFNWNMGFFAPSMPGATHGFIQTFWPNLGTTDNYVQVLANSPGEFFRMTDIEQLRQSTPGFMGLMDIGGNMNNASPQ